MSEVLRIDGGAPVRTEPMPQRELYGPEAEALVLEALRSQSLFGMGGRFHARFESEFAAFYGAEHAIATSSGTSAVHTALAALDLEPGSEVITAPITDAGTIVPILFQHCVPVFADVDKHYGMDPDEIASKITDRTGAILVVHLFGAGCDLRRISRLARSRGIPLIEDCSQSHATQLDGRWLGRWGDIGAFSMQQSKHLATGEGGVAITDNPDYAWRMRAFRDKGWDRGRPGARDYPILGLNYRLTELQAAVALSQMAGLRARVQQRQELGQQLSAGLDGVDGVSLHRAAPGSEHSYWLLGLEIDPTYWSPVDFARALQAEGIPAGAGYTGEPIYLCMKALSGNLTFGTSGYPLTGPHRPPVSYQRGLCPRAEALLERVLTLPLHEGFDGGDVDDMVAAIRKVARLLPRRPVPAIP